MFSPRIFGLSFSILFFLSNVAFVHTAEANIWEERKKQVASLPASFQSLPPVPTPQRHLQANATIKRHPGLEGILSSISQAHVRVENILTPPSTPSKGVVIHISDVHRNAEAQANIGMAVGSLINNRKVDLIALEGAHDRIKIQELRQVPNREVLNDVADIMVKDFRLSGPVHAAITSPASSVPPVVGIEDPIHYQANVDAYVQSHTRKEGVAQKINEERRKLEMTKKKVFNAPLHKFDVAVSQFEKENISMAAFLRTLSEASPAHSNAIETFILAYDLENKINFEKVERERTQIINQLVQKIDEKGIQDLQAYSISYRMGHLRHDEFYQFLEKLCQAHQVDLKKFPAFQNYIDYVLLAYAVSAETLYDDMDRLRDTAYKKLIQSKEEAKLVEASRNLLLKSRLTRFALTPNEWNEYKERGLSLPHASFENFYKEAEIRDEKMVFHLKNQMERQEARTALMVTGGFHANGVSRQLLNQGYTVVSLTPNITKIETDAGSDYLSVFAQEKTPIEDLFEGKKLFLGENPASPANIGGLASVTVVRLRALGTPFVALSKWFTSVTGLVIMSIKNSRISLKTKADPKGVSRDLIVHPKSAFYWLTRPISKTELLINVALIFLGLAALNLLNIGFSSLAVTGLLLTFPDSRAHLKNIAIKSFQWLQLFFQSWRLDSPYRSEEVKRVADRLEEIHPRWLKPMSIPDIVGSLAGILLIFSFILFEQYALGVGGSVFFYGFLIIGFDTVADFFNAAFTRTKNFLLNMAPILRVLWWSWVAAPPSSVTRLKVQHDDVIQLYESGGLNFFATDDNKAKTVNGRINLKFNDWFKVEDPFQMRIAQTRFIYRFQRSFQAFYKRKGYKNAVVDGRVTSREAPFYVNEDVLTGLENNGYYQSPEFYALVETYIMRQIGERKTPKRSWLNLLSYVLPTNKQAYNWAPLTFEETKPGSLTHRRQVIALELMKDVIKTIVPKFELQEKNLQPEYTATGISPPLPIRFWSMITIGVGYIMSNTFGNWAIKGVLYSTIIGIFEFIFQSAREITQGIQSILPVQISSEGVILGIGAFSFTLFGWFGKLFLVFVVVLYLASIPGFTAAKNYNRRVYRNHLLQSLLGIRAKDIRSQIKTEMETLINSKPSLKVENQVLKEVLRALLATTLVNPKFDSLADRIADFRKMEEKNFPIDRQSLALFLLSELEQANNTGYETWKTRWKRKINLKKKHNPQNPYSILYKLTTMTSSVSPLATKLSQIHDDSRAEELKRSGADHTDNTLVVLGARVQAEAAAAERTTRDELGFHNTFVESSATNSHDFKLAEQPSVVVAAGAIYVMGYISDILLDLERSRESMNIHRGDEIASGQQIADVHTDALENLARNIPDHAPVFRQWKQHIESLRTRLRPLVEIINSIIADLDQEAGDFLGRARTEELDPLYLLKTALTSDEMGFINLRALPFDLHEKAFNHVDQAAQNFLPLAYLVHELYRWTGDFRSDPDSTEFPVSSMLPPTLLDALKEFFDEEEEAVDWVFNRRHVVQPTGEVERPKVGPRHLKSYKAYMAGKISQRKLRAGLTRLYVVGKGVRNKYGLSDPVRTHINNLVQWIVFEREFPDQKNRLEDELDNLELKLANSGITLTTVKSSIEYVLDHYLDTTKDEAEIRQQFGNEAGLAKSTMKTLKEFSKNKAEETDVYESLVSLYRARRGFSENQKLNEDEKTYVNKLKEFVVTVIKGNVTSKNLKTPLLNPFENSFSNLYDVEAPRYTRTDTPDGKEIEATQERRDHVRKSNTDAVVFVVTQARDSRLFMDIDLTPEEVNEMDSTSNVGRRGIERARDERLRNYLAQNPSIDAFLNKTFRFLEPDAEQADENNTRPPTPAEKRAILQLHYFQAYMQAVYSRSNPSTWLSRVTLKTVAEEGWAAIYDIPYVLGSLPYLARPDLELVLDLIPRIKGRKDEEGSFNDILLIPLDQKRQKVADNVKAFRNFSEGEKTIYNVLSTTRGDLWVQYDIVIQGIALGYIQFTTSQRLEVIKGKDPEFKNFLDKHSQVNVEEFKIWQARQRWKDKTTKATLYTVKPYNDSTKKIRLNQHEVEHYLKNHILFFEPDTKNIVLRGTSLSKFENIVRNDRAQVQQLIDGQVDFHVGESAPGVDDDFSLTGSMALDAAARGLIVRKHPGSSELIPAVDNRTFMREEFQAMLGRTKGHGAIIPDQNEFWANKNEIDSAIEGSEKSQLGFNPKNNGFYVIKGNPASEIRANRSSLVKLLRNTKKFNLQEEDRIIEVSKDSIVESVLAGHLTVRRNIPMLVSPLSEVESFLHNAPHTTTVSSPVRVRLGWSLLPFWARVLLSPIVILTETLSEFSHVLVGLPFGKWPTRLIVDQKGARLEYKGDYTDNDNVAIASADIVASVALLVTSFVLVSISILSGQLFDWSLYSALIWAGLVAGTLMTEAHIYTRRIEGHDSHRVLTWLQRRRIAQRIVGILGDEMPQMFKGTSAPLTRSEMHRELMAVMSESGQSATISEYMIQAALMRAALKRSKASAISDVVPGRTMALPASASDTSWITELIKRNPNRPLLLITDSENKPALEQAFGKNPNVTVLTANGSEDFKQASLFDSAAVTDKNGRVIDPLHFSFVLERHLESLANENGTSIESAMQNVAVAFREGTRFSNGLNSTILDEMTIIILNQSWMAHEFVKGGLTNMIEAAKVALINA